MAKSVEELQVYQRALGVAHEISAILNRRWTLDDRRLREQLGASSERVASLIAEGFGMKTDRHFASYLYLSRGSAKETRTQLRVAEGRDYISKAEVERLCSEYNEIEKMLTGLIRHLNRENRQLRG
jgi:four helix bundle protein